jgi:hypothetical protein
MGLILGALMGANSEAAVAVFSTLQNARARRDALNAVAEFKLNERQQELFSAILTIVGSAEKERNHLAHGCYGTSPAIQDGILWVESKRFGTWNIATVLKETQVTADEYQDLAKSIFVYRKADLGPVFS